MTEIIITAVLAVANLLFAIFGTNSTVKSINYFVSGCTFAFLFMFTVNKANPDMEYLPETNGALEYKIAVQDYCLEKGEWVDFERIDSLFAERNPEAGRIITEP